MEKGYNDRLEKHAMNLLIAGPVFWVISSIHNLCQVYERANGHVQILQKGVQIPFLMGSLLLFVGGFFNRHDVYGSMLVVNFLITFLFSALLVIIFIMFILSQQFLFARKVSNCVCHEG